MKKIKKENNTSENNKIIQGVDELLLLGLLTYVVYNGLNHYYRLPDVVSYPWMLISIVLMLVGIYREGKWLGKFFHKNKEKDNTQEAAEQDEKK